MTPFFRISLFVIAESIRNAKYLWKPPQTPSFLGVGKVTDGHQSGSVQYCTGELLWHMGLSGSQGLSTCSSQKHQGWHEPIFFTIFSVAVFKHNFIISLKQCLLSSKLRQPKLCLLINFYHAVNIGLYRGRKKG